MLKTTLTHPDILRVVARAGHHAKILIADGNYPASTKRGPQAELISLNLVNTMGIPPDDPYAQHGEPPVWNDYRAVIAESGSKLTLEPILKWDFYKHVESPDHVLTIQTADRALWANVLLTIGCRTD
jgi:L-fucose mutarotase